MPAYGGGSGSSGGYGGGSGGGSKKKHDWRDEVLKGISFGPGLIQKYGGPLSFIGSAGAALGTSPLQVLLWPKQLPGGIASSVVGAWEGPYAFGKSLRPKERGGGGMSLTEASDMFLQGMKANYKERFGKDWEDHAHDNGLYNLFDALSVVGGTARAATLLGAADRLGSAGMRIGMRDLWRESGAPGIVSEGVDYVPRMRNVGFQPEVGARDFVEQPWSRSPVRQGMQAAADTMAERFPDVPLFGARSRVARGGGSIMRRMMERTLGTVHGEEALNALSPAARTRLYWEGTLGAATGDDGPLIRLRDALAREFDGNNPSKDTNPEFAQILHEAKQAGFGGETLKELDAAIDYNPHESRKSIRQYDAARSAMRQATQLGERTIADSNGFSALEQDLKMLGDRINMLEPGSDAYKAAITERTKLRMELSDKGTQLKVMFDNRRNLVRDWLDTQGDHEHSRAWHEALTQLLGKEEADRSVTFAHVMANRARPDDPESFWADKVGMPSREGAAMFRERVGEDALFQFGESGTGLLDSGFYSNTQKAVREGMPEQMPKEEFLSWLEENVPKEELYNSGLDMYLQALEPGTVIQKQDFLHVLANKLNAYNLRQIVRINSEEGDLGMPAIFDLGEEGNYVSRGKLPHDGGFVPHEGEYYEVQFELPGPGRDEAYRGKGYGHWQRENVVAHFRFHVFTEDGKKKLLIEEIQSDWANEWRVAKQTRAAQEAMSPAMRHAYEEVKVQRDEAWTELQNLITHRDRLDSEIRAAETEVGTRERGTSDLEGEWYNVIDRIDRVKEDYRQYERLIEEYDGGDVGDVPPSPLGIGTGAKSSYVNSPIRWLGRFAVENDVEQVILISREAQLVRNAKVIDPRDWYGGLKEAGAEAVTKHIRENMPDKVSYKGYENDLPRRMRQEWGVKGQAVDDAYEGFYRHPADMNRGGEAHGRMPGTVFDVNDLFRENALKPAALYQRTPDWNALPKGAVELLDGGKSRIHIFEGGDVSTWIHELGHVALSDLSDADRGLVESHFGGGKKIAEWTDMEHEDFARAFEEYVREGVAPTPQLRSVFAKLSAWIKTVWEREQRVNQNIPPEVAKVFSNLFKSEDNVDIFIPHRAYSPDLAGGRIPRGIPRANREIGDRAISRIPLFKKNTLGLLRSGLLDTDPRHTMEHANRVVALARANQMREAVLHMGRPLLTDEQPNFKKVYVVKRAGRGVDKPLFDAIESADNPEEIATTVKNYIDDHITDEQQKFDAWKTESQLYVVDKKQVDMLFKYVTGKAPGAATKPITNTSKVIDATLDSFRGLLLFANPGFYVTNMIGNAGMLTLKDAESLKYLPDSINQGMKAAVRPESVDPQWERISVEMGRGPTAGAFSLGSAKDILNARPGETGNLVGRGAEWWSQALGAWGRRSGRVIDDAYRVAAWKGSAAKRGYNTRAKIDALFNDESVLHPFRGKGLHLESKAEKDLAAIRDEAEQLMLDFDSLSPAERTYLQRGIFLYPFVKASAKYPVMFAGERPIVAGLGMEAGHQGAQFANQVLGERPDLPLWLQGYARGPGGYYNVGSFSPFSMQLGLIQSIMGAGGPAEAGVQRPADYFNPVYQMLYDALRQQNAYGRDASAPSILRDEVPLPGYLRYPIRKPSSQYAERDFWNTLLRAFRAYPTELTGGQGTGGIVGGGSSGGGYGGSSGGRSYGG